MSKVLLTPPASTLLTQPHPPILQLQLLYPMTKCNYWVLLPKGAKISPGIVLRYMLLPGPKDHFSFLFASPSKSEILGLYGVTATAAARKTLNATRSFFCRVWGEALTLWLK